MDVDIDSIYKWQTLIGAIMGGVFALAVAFIVSYKAQRRDEISSGYIVISSLVSFVGANKVLLKHAEKNNISDENYPIWVCERLVSMKPSLSALYETAMARIISKNNRLAINLSVISTTNCEIESAFKRVEADFEYHSINGRERRSATLKKADAALVSRGFNKIADNSECAVHLVTMLVTSHFPTWNRFKMYFCPKDIDKKVISLTSGSSAT